MLDLRKDRLFLTTKRFADGTRLVYNENVKELYLPMYNDFNENIWDYVPHEYSKSVEKFGILICCENDKKQVDQKIFKSTTNVKFQRQCTSFSIFFQQKLGPFSADILDLGETKEEDLQLPQWLGICPIQTENVFRIFFQDPCCIVKLDLGLYQIAPQKHEQLTTFRNLYTKDINHNFTFSKKFDINVPTGPKASISLDLTHSQASQRTMFHILFPKENGMNNTKQWRIDLKGLKHLVLVNFVITDATLLGAMIDQQINPLCSPDLPHWKPSEMIIEIQNASSDILRSPRFCQLLVERQCHLLRRGFIACSRKDFHNLTQLENLKSQQPFDNDANHFTAIQKKAMELSEKSKQIEILSNTEIGQSSIEIFQDPEKRIEIVMESWMPPYYCRNWDLLQYRKCNKQTDLSLAEFNDAWKQWNEEEDLIGETTMHHVPSAANRGISLKDSLMVDRDIFLRYHFLKEIADTLNVWIFEKMLGLCTQMDPANIVFADKAVGDTCTLLTQNMPNLVNGYIMMGLKMKPILLAAGYFEPLHNMIRVYSQWKNFLQR